MKRALAVIGLLVGWAVFGFQIVLLADALGAEDAVSQPVGEDAVSQRAVQPRPVANSSRPRADKGSAPQSRQPDPVRVALAGDVHAEPPIAGVLQRGDNPLGGMARTLRSADIATANVETAVGVTGLPAAKEFTFRADPRLWPALRRAGVDVVSLANNHALDYGREALAETIAGAREAGLRVVGAGQNQREAYRAQIVRRNGQRIAFVGLTQVLPTLDWAAGPDRPGLASAYNERAALRAVRVAAARADRVVVMVHWGQEFEVCPDPAQRALAKKLRAAGADVVAGHHPHVLQAIERRKRGLVAFSLGNFAFYAREERTRATGVLTVTLDERGVAGHRFQPARIDDEGSPRPIRGVERRERLDGLRALASDCA